MDVQHGAIGATELLDLFRFDPASEFVIRARLHWSENRPTDIAAWLGRDFGASTAGVPDVPERELAASAMCRCPPGGGPITALFLEGRIGNQVCGVSGLCLRCGRLVSGEHCFEEAGVIARR